MHTHTSSIIVRHVSLTELECPCVCVPADLQITILDGLSKSMEFSDDAIIQRNSLIVAPLVGKK